MNHPHAKKGPISVHWRGTNACLLIPKLPGSLNDQHYTVCWIFPGFPIPLILYHFLSLWGSCNKYIVLPLPQSLPRRQLCCTVCKQGTDQWAKEKKKKRGTGFLLHLKQEGNLERPPLLSDLSLTLIFYFFACADYLHIDCLHTHNVFNNIINPFQQKMLL